MRITQEADYALRIILYLCKLGENVRVDAATIAEHEKIPLRFLLKLIRKLTKNKIVKSYRGIKGGYALNMKPEDITLRCVIEAIDGPIFINKCLNKIEFCTADKQGKCTVHAALKSVQEKIVKELDGVNFKMLSTDHIKVND